MLMAHIPNQPKHTAQLHTHTRAQDILGVYVDVLCAVKKSIRFFSCLTICFVGGAGGNFVPGNFQ